MSSRRQRSITLGARYRQVSLYVAEFEQLITGSKYSSGVGNISAPPGYPLVDYKRDATSHVFILENIQHEGSVQLEVKVFDLHPDSWLTVGTLTSHALSDNGRHGVSNHQHFDRLFNSLPSNLALCLREPTGDWRILLQRVSNAKGVSTPWSHHGILKQTCDWLMGYMWPVCRWYPAKRALPAMRKPAMLTHGRYRVGPFWQDTIDVFRGILFNKKSGYKPSFEPTVSIVTNATQGRQYGTLVFSLLLVRKTVKKKSPVVCRWFWRQAVVTPYGVTMSEWVNSLHCNGMSCVIYH